MGTSEPEACPEDSPHPVACYRLGPQGSRGPDSRLLMRGSGETNIRFFIRVFGKYKDYIGIILRQKVKGYLLYY